MSATLVLTERLPESGMRKLAEHVEVTVRVLPAPTAIELARALPSADGVIMVMEQPARAGNPLLARDDVVLTPHTAGYTRTAFDRMALACAENALAGLDGTLDPAQVVNAEGLRCEEGNPR